MVCGCVESDTVFPSPYSLDPSVSMYQYLRVFFVPAPSHSQNLQVRFYLSCVEV